MTEKTCPKCKEVKLFTDFYQNKYSKTNTSSYCKPCSNARTTSYAKSNSDKIQPKLAGYALKRRYGISVEEYATMLEAQGFKCGICSVENDPTGRNFAVDHCHATGKIRGLLCSNCNTALGSFKDSVDRLKSAIQYLESKQCTT